MKFYLNQIFIVLILQYLQQANSGYINYIDYQHDFANEGLTKDIQITFQLQNILDVQSYILLKLPFQIQNSTAFWTETDTNTCKNQLPLNLQKCSIYVQDNSYFLNNFLDEQLIPQILSSDKWYMIYLRQNQTIIRPQGNLKPIQIYTVSTREENYIIYDENQVFCSVDFGPTVSPSINLIDWIVPQPLSMNEIYPLKFVIRPSIQGGQKILIQFDNNIFTFQRTCNSSNLTTDQYTCTIYQQNQLQIELNNPLQIGIYEFAINIILPPSVANTSISYYLMHRYDNYVIQYQTFQNLNTQFVQVQDQKVKLSWGIDLTSRTSKLFALYKNDGQNIVYNTIRFEFRPYQNLISLNYLLILELGSNIKILPNSISHNFKNYDFNPVRCIPGGDTTKQIEISNIQALKSDTKYFIILKITIDQSSSQSDIQKLGLIHLYPMINGQYDRTVSSLQVSNEYAKKIVIASNYDRIVRDKTTDNLAFHSKSSQQISLSNAGAGIKFMFGIHQTIEMVTRLTESDFENWSNTNGIDIYTSYDVLANKNEVTDCYGQIDISSQINICSVKNVPDFNTQLLNMRLGLSNAVVFDGNSRIGFNNILVKKTAYFQPEESFDFYLGTVTSGLTVDSTLNNTEYYRTFIFNSYVLNTQQLNGIVAGVSNFWTDDEGSQSLSGDQFPSILRIYGYLNVNEKDNLQQIAIFFDQLSAFQDTADQTMAACSTSVYGSSCESYQGDQDAYLWIYSSRVLISLEIQGNTEDNQLQIIIPVSTSPGHKDPRIRVGILDQQNKLTYLSKSFNFFFNITNNQPTLYQMNILGFNNIYGYNYSLQTSQKKVGMSTNATFYLYQTEVVPNTYVYNAFSSQKFAGAAFMYVGKWNFFVDPNFQIEDNSLFQTSNQQKCMTFSYLYKLDGRYGFHCPIYGPLGIDSTSQFKIQSFTYPSLNGIRVPDAYSTISDINGLLVKYYKDDSDQMQPNKLILLNNPVSFDLNYGQKQLRPKFAFKTQSTLPAQFIIQISCIGGWLNFIVNEKLNFYNVCNLYQKGRVLQTKKCYQKNIQNSIQVFVIVASQLQPDEYTIELGGVNVIAQPQTSQLIQISTKSWQGHPIEVSQNYELFYNLIDKNMKLEVNTPQYFTNIKKARTFVQFQFSIIGRSIYKDEKIVFDLDFLNQDNLNNNLLCKVNNIDGLPSYQWKICSIDITYRFKKVTLVPKTDIIGTSHVFILQINQIYVSNAPINYNMNAYLKNELDENILYQLDIPVQTRRETNMMDYSQIYLKKKMSNAMGSLCELQFSIQPKAENLDVNSQIIIYLPSYYPINTGQYDPFCMINQLYTRCEFSLPRMLTIKDIPMTLLKDQNIELIIGGLPVPQTTEMKTFFISLKNQKEIIEFGEVLDVAVQQQTIKQIIMNNFIRTSDSWIVQNEYTFNIKLVEQIPFETTYLSIDFPRQWVNKNQKKENITCYLDIINTTCQQLGHQISIKINKPLLANQDYNFTLQGFRNPDNNDCIPQGVVLSILKDDRQVVLARSYSTIQNFDKLSFYLDLNSNTLWKWQIVQMDNSTQGKQIISDFQNKLILYRGTYSQTLRISLANDKRVNRDVKISFTKSLNDLTYFVMSPKQIEFVTGDYYQDVRIGVQRNVTKGLYYTYFTTEERGGNFYDILPGLKINLNEEQLQLSMPNLALISIPVGGYSLPIQLDFQTFPPYQTLVIESSIPIFPDLSLDYGYVSDYVLSVQKSSQDVQLRSNQAPQSNQNTSLEFYLQESDKLYFKLPYNKIPIQLLYVYENIIFFTDFQIQQVTPVSATIQITTSQISTVYYQVQYKYSSLVFDFQQSYQWVFQNKIFDFDYFDVDQQQFGRVVISQANTTQLIQINNLISNQTYSIKLWIQNLQQIISSEKQTEFTTKENGDFMFRLDITGQKIYENSARIACELCGMFQYPYNMIRTQHEVFCDQGQVQNAGVFIQQTDYFYFYPFTYVSAYQKLNTFFDVDDLKNSNNLTKYKDMLNQKLENIVQGLKFDGRVFKHAPVIINQGQISSTSDSIFLQNVQLENNGMIWLILEKMEISLKGKIVQIDLPTYQQIKNGLNSSNLPALIQSFQIYKNQPINYKFEQLLPDSYYRVSFIASSEDPSPNKILSNMQVLQVYTKAGSQIKIYLQIILLILLFINI